MHPVRWTTWQPLLPRFNVFCCQHSSPNFSPPLPSSQHGHNTRSKRRYKTQEAGEHCRLSKESESVSDYEVHSQGAKVASSQTTPATLPGATVRLILVAQLRCTTNSTPDWGHTSYSSLSAPNENSSQFTPISSPTQRKFTSPSAMPGSLSISCLTRMSLSCASTVYSFTPELYSASRKTIKTSQTTVAEWSMPMQSGRDSHIATSSV